ncbi:hypothetical protein [Prosthecobacter debontii]|nr:hypothetical protein [Prosthecobacter debontii]
MKRFLRASGLMVLLSLGVPSMSAAESGKEGRTLEDILSQIPDKELGKLRGGRDAAALAEVSKKLSAAEATKAATLRVKLDKAEEWDFPNQGNVKGWRVQSEVERLRAAGLYLEGRVTLYIKQEAVSELPKFRSGAEFLVTGQVSRCDVLQPSNGKTILNVDIQVSKLVEAKK